VVAEVARLTCEAQEAGTAVERAEWLAGLRRVVDTAEVGFTAVLARFDAHGDAEVLTGSSTATWCRTELRIGAGDAQSRLRLARLAGVEPELAAALRQVADGRLRFEQVRQIAHSVRSLDGDPRQGEAVTVLKDLAATADPSTIAAAGRRIRDVVNPDGALTARERQLQSRYLTLSPLLDGMTAVEGLLDAETTATVNAALAPLMVPAGGDDSRSAPQRRADALAEVAALALRTGELPRLSGTLASVDVVITAETLVAAGVSTPARGPRAGMAPSRAAGGGALAGLQPSRGGVVLDHPGRPAVLPPSAVARLLCDGSVGRIVLGPDSVPLDLGRRRRVFTAEQRRALSLRDAGCRFPGCDRPPRYTDVHHVVLWTAGGPTDLDNGLLLCRWHHRQVHPDDGRQGWRVSVVDPTRGTHGPLLFRSAVGAELTSKPRGP
jgi:hypothetical protein